MLSMFSKTQDDKDKQLILVYAGSVEKVREKLDRFKLRCPTFVPQAGDTDFGRVFDRYRIHAYPTIVDINIRGNVDSHTVGTLNTE